MLEHFGRKENISTRRREIKQFLARLPPSLDFRLSLPCALCLFNVPNVIRCTMRGLPQRAIFSCIVVVGKEEDSQRAVAYLRPHAACVKRPPPLPFHGIRILRRFDRVSSSGQLAQNPGGFMLPCSCFATTLLTSGSACYAFAIEKLATPALHLTGDSPPQHPTTLPIP